MLLPFDNEHTDAWTSPANLEGHGQTGNPSTDDHHVVVIRAGALASVPCAERPDETRPLVCGQISDPDSGLSHHRSPCRRRVEAPCD
jgi:hypothetical protein